ncbi:MAG: hypothetical protein A3F17_02225 [Gammaproteobacteria bacterium RIFCSPHIGHO2_12_FULL_41_15]|nr:MAG: hypothetical protein A3F17_02225 [Gammaproteobacteria bacterium RIFCSPHIGHO2_12_FULL_41_15]
MKKSPWHIICAAAACLVMPNAQATDLIDVYNQSLESDPVFKEAEAQWLSAKTALPLARAGIFPQIDLAGKYSHGYNRIDSTGQQEVSNWNSQTGYDIKLVQPIFNYQAWESISEASASVKSATALYLSSSQVLMSRVATAYFEVLRANQTLKYTQSEKNTLYQTLQQQQQEYRVGLIAITGVYNAQSQYDSIVALEIANRNTLSDRLEDLRAITGRYYPELSGLKNRVPLTRPEPSNINAWVNIAGQHNYGILAQKYAVVAARTDIKVQASGNFPTLSLTSNYSGIETHGGTSPGYANSFDVGAGVDFPIFQGGATTANTDKARYDFLNSSATLEQTYRDTLNNTRQSYMNVSALIYKINADLQSIKSKQNNLSATRAGYRVGTRTMVDVLQAIQELTEAQKDFANDQYDYILSTVALKADAGTLSVADLQKINLWLTTSLKFDTAIRAELKNVSVNPNASLSNFSGQRAHQNHHTPYQTSRHIIPPKPPAPKLETRTSTSTQVSSTQSLSKTDMKQSVTTAQKTVSTQKQITLPEPLNDQIDQQTNTPNDQINQQTSTPNDQVTHHDNQAISTPMKLEEPFQSKQGQTVVQVEVPQSTAMTPETTVDNTQSASMPTIQSGSTGTTTPAPTTMPLDTTQTQTTTPAPASTTVPMNTTPSGSTSTIIPDVVTDTQTQAIQKSTTVTQPDTAVSSTTPDNTNTITPSSTNTPEQSKQFLTDPNANLKLKPSNIAANSHFSIQLYASPKLDQAQQFIKTHHLKNIALTSTTKNGHIWYEILYGEYANYSQAKQMKSRLPKELQTSWIKQT